MSKRLSKRALVNVESLESRQLLSGTPIGLVASPLLGTVGQADGTAYLLVPNQVSPSGSTAPGTTTKIQIIIPSEVLNTPVTKVSSPLTGLTTSVTTESSTLTGEPSITLQFNTLTGPVKVQLDAPTPQGEATFLDYVESGAFNNSLFASLGLQRGSNSTMPPVSEATVNTNGSLTLTGGTTLTLPHIKLTTPSSLKFEFDTSFGSADVELKGAKTPETVATFMDYVESGAMLEAVIQRLAPATQPSTTTPFVLDATRTDGSIILTGGNTESKETIVLPGGIIVNVPPASPATSSDTSLQFITTSGVSFDVQLPNVPHVLKETIADIEATAGAAGPTGATGTVGDPVPVINNLPNPNEFGNLGSNTFTNQTDEDLEQAIHNYRRDGLSPDDELIKDRELVLAARHKAARLVNQGLAEQAAGAGLNQAAAALQGVAPGAAAGLSAAADALNAQGAADVAAGQALGNAAGSQNAR